VAVDSAVVPTYLAAAAVLDFASIAAGACAESTMSLPGALGGPGGAGLAGEPGEWIDRDDADQRQQHGGGQSL